MFGPRFPLFSRCFPAVRAQFPLFSRCFPAIFPLFSVHFGVFKVLRSNCTKKPNFQKFCPKQWFCGQNEQKNKIFKNFVQNSGFAAKTHKKTEFSDFYPNQVKTDKKNKFFRNLAQNRSKRTKRQNFQKSCFEKAKTHQKTHFSEFVCKTVRLQSKHTNKTKFSEILARTAVCGQSVQNKFFFRN